MGTKELKALEKEIAEAHQADIIKCQEEIKISLEKYGCLLDPLVTITGTGVQANVRIIKNMN